MQHKTTPTSPFPAVKNTFLPTLVILISLVVFQGTQVFGASQQIRILALGDSITQAENRGNDNYNSYRRALWQLLQSNGYTNVDFVGSWDVAYPNQSPPDPDFDMDHEGHWGWFAEEIINGCIGCPSNSGSGKLSDWLQGYTPDIVLLHIGSNDLKGLGTDEEVVDQTIVEIGQIIDVLRADNPELIILLAQLIPSTRSPRDRRVPLLNAEIPTLAQNKTQPNSPVIVVDQFTGINTLEDLYDGTHPNVSGEQKMAQRWFDALIPLLNGIPTATFTNTPAPTSPTTPTPTNTPVLPTPTATPSGSYCNNADILFVSISQQPPIQDQLIVDQIEAQGHTVIIRNQKEVVTNDAIGKDLILISDSISSSRVGNTFTDVTVPVVTWEAGLFDDMHLTGSSSGSDFGYVNAQTQVNIVDSTHPLANGLTNGALTVLTSSNRFFWGVPAADGITVATLAGDNSRSVIFAYELGDTMVGMTAPARRVAFFNGDSPDYNDQAWQLFDAALVWGLGCD